MLTFDFQISVKTLQLDDGKMIAANKFGQTSEEQVQLELTDDELKITKNIKVSQSGHSWFLKNNFDKATTLKLLMINRQIFTKVSL